MLKLYQTYYDDKRMMRVEIERLIPPAVSVLQEEKVMTLTAAVSDPLPGYTDP